MSSTAAWVWLVVAGLVLSLAIGWRSRGWRLNRLPLAMLVGVALAAFARWYVDSQGLADDPAPRMVWVWVGLTGLATAVSVLGWRSARWWRRGISLLAVLLCLLSSAVSLNLWVGYFRTVQTAWNQLTAGPLPDETDADTVAAMQQSGTVPTRGAVLPVTIPGDASHFTHRTESAAALDVAPDGADPHRPVGVVDPRREVRGIEVDDVRAVREVVPAGLVAPARRPRRGAGLPRGDGRRRHRRRSRRRGRRRRSRLRWTGA